MKRALIFAVFGCLSVAAASAAEFEIAGFVGRALPTFEQSFRYAPERSGIPGAPGFTVRQEGSFDLDAKGGLALGGAATVYLAGPLGIEVRLDSIELELQLSAARFEATVTPPAPLRPISATAEFPPGTIGVDPVRPVSLNLKLRTRGPVRLTVSGGGSYLPELSARATQPLGLGVVGLTSQGPQFASLAVQADTQALLEGTEGKLGWNAGAGIQIQLGSKLALVAEARGFLFKKRRLVWSAAEKPRTALESVLLAEVLRSLEPVEFTPTTYQATAGLALTF